jgi:ATP-dependent exoDNAse (exonuclease V) beta subunit
MRYYDCPGGKRYPSVTTILSKTKPKKTEDALDNWRKRIGEDHAEKVFNNACHRGTLMHSLCENYLLGNEIDLSDETVLPYWTSIKQVLPKIKNVKFLEQKVHHDRFLYAGTLDCLAEWDGLTTLIDFKSADKIKSPGYVIDYYLQVVAYAAAANYLFDIKIDQAVIIIGVANHRPQTFVLDRPTMIIYWSMWLKRVEQFYKIYK